MKDSQGIDTQLIHAGEAGHRYGGAVCLPVFQTANYAFRGEDGEVLRYARLNNSPNHEVLAAKVAALERADDAVVTASGMAAVSTALLAVLGARDHLLVQDSLYGGTHGFVRDELPAFGVDVDWIDPDDPASWAAKRKPNTKAIYVESISNPLLRVADLPAVVAFARAEGLVSLIDSTFTSPVNYRPIEAGFDLSLQSATKYLNGHSDIVAGTVAGRGDLVERVKRRLDHLGASLDPHACMLLHRGMKTLGLRMRQQNASTQALAEALERHDAVREVNYPGLASHPRHGRARDLFAGSGGVLSFDLHGGLDAARAFLRNVTIAMVAPSLGGVETLVTLPATTSHKAIPGDERRAMGIGDGLVRVAVGIESTDDLVADFVRALDAAR